MLDFEFEFQLDFEFKFEFKSEFSFLVGNLLVSKLYFNFNNSIDYCFLGKIKHDRLADFYVRDICPSIKFGLATYFA